jgi:hypothetical protein
MKFKSSFSYYTYLGKIKRHPQTEKFIDTQTTFKILLVLISVFHEKRSTEMVNPAERQNKPTNKIIPDAEVQ